MAAISKSDLEFLQVLDERSQRERESFLDNIAKRLGRSRLDSPPERKTQGSPDFWRDRELTEEEKIEQFSMNWRKADGRVERFADLNGASCFIRDLSQELKGKYLIRQDQSVLAKLDLESIEGAETVVWNAEHKTGQQKAELAAAAAGSDIGVVLADHAVAHTGTVIVSSSPQTGRTVSLLPTVLIVIVPVDGFKTRLGEVFTPLDDLPRKDLPAGIHLISGPSRSSDIENELTIGVHGPGIVYALIVDNVN